MKKLLLALAILAYACLFYNRDQDGMEALAQGTVQINEKITVNSTQADMSEFGIDSTDRFQAISASEAIRIFEAKSSGILFFAKNGSVECKIAAQILNEAAEELQVKVYIVNTSEEMSEEDYTTLCSYIEPTFSVDEAGNSAFFVPDLMAVKDGEIKGYHVSTVKGIAVSTNDTIELTDEQKASLKKDYLKVIRSIDK